MSERTKYKPDAGVRPQQNPASVFLNKKFKNNLIKNYIYDNTVYVIRTDFSPTEAKL